MTINPLEEFLAVMEEVSGRRLDPGEATAVLLESALGDEGWFGLGLEVVPEAMVLA